MARELDWDWLHAQAGNEETRQGLREIALLRQELLNENRLPSSGPPFVLELGAKRFFFPRSCVCSLLEVYEESFRNDDHFLWPGFKPDPGSVILDIGANCGFYALHCIELCKDCRLVCCEPVPETFALLTKNLELNESLAGVKQVLCKPVALGADSGRAKIVYSPYYPALSGEMLLAVQRPWFKREWLREAVVEQTRLQDLCTDLGLSEVDILKIDVEGAELGVLKGALPILSRVARIVVEYHSQALRAGIIALLKAEGFILVFEVHSGPYYGDLYFVQSGVKN